MIRKIISIATLTFILLPYTGALVSSIPVREIKEELIVEDADNDDGFIPEVTIPPKTETTEEVITEEVPAETAETEPVIEEQDSTIETSLLEQENISNSVSDIESNAVEQEEQDGYQIEMYVMAQIITREIGSGSYAEKASVAWCILNRVDAGYCGGDMLSVMVSPHQFAYYGDGYYTEECYAVAEDVIESWLLEKAGYNVNRVLAKNYLWFLGDGRHNWFYANYADFAVDLQNHTIGYTNALCGGCSE